MRTPLRLGIVGVGSIALRGLFPHLTMDDVQDRVHVVSACDPVPGRAAAAGEKFGFEHGFETFEEMLEANVVDAVSIASPIGLHYEQGLMAVEHGIHLHFRPFHRIKCPLCRGVPLRSPKEGTGKRLPLRVIIFVE